MAAPRRPVRGIHDASDAALLRAARLGDHDAFAVIVDRFGPGMYRYAYRLLGNQADAADAVQDAFISAWRNLQSIRRAATLRTWLFRIVARRAADIQRVRRPVPIDDELLTAFARPADDNPLREATEAELVEALRRALAELPWHQRAVWLLREIEDMSYREISIVLGMTVPRVRGHLHRARRTLAIRMERWR